jgi:lauroyl/myristoyl acyltransferase
MKTCAYNKCTNWIKLVLARLFIKRATQYPADFRSSIILNEGYARENISSPFILCNRINLSMRPIFMNLQNTLNSRFGIALGFVLSRLPRVAGYRAAEWIADRVSSQKNTPGVQAVRANQWVIHNQRISTAELNQMVINTYRNTARGLYEFWHFLPKKAAVVKMVEFDQTFFDCIQTAKEKGEGLLIVLPHLANFDLVGHAAVLNGIKLHVLSYPQPPGGYRWQNKLRKLEGLNITPLSIEALRLASDTLRSGGIVTTGIDRPLAGADRKYQVTFFGRKALLPVFHIRLALKHNVSIAVIGGCKKSDDKYLVWASHPIRMKRMDHLVDEIVYNAEAILDISANDIRQAPDQWAMYYPVWPEALDLISA